MLNLIAKDFKLMFAKNGSRSTRILSWIFSLLVGASFIVIETYIFYMILNKVSAYDGAGEAFFVVFLFIVSLLMIVVGVFTAKKSFFSEKDVVQLSTYPVSNAKRVLSKLFFIAITMYLFNLVFTMPLFIAYGATFHKMLVFFYTSLYYPLLILLFELGFAFILVYPVKLFIDFLKKHFFIQLIVTIAISFGLAIAYSYILNIFINLVSNNELGSLFTTDNVSLIKTISDYLIPVNFLIKAIVEYDFGMVFPYIGISIGIFIIGLAIVIYFYSHFSYVGSNAKKKAKEHAFKERSQAYALAKKELIILFRNTDYLFSFTSLLFVEPLLTYLVVKAINVIFSSGNIAYYVAVVPNLIPLTDVLLMLLFGAIISSGSANYISSEKKSVRFIKSIPVSPIKQLFVKVAIPLSVSLLFNLLSWIVLLAIGTISWVTFLYGFILTSILTIIVNIISLYEELKIKRGKDRNYLLSTIYSYILPFVFYLLSILMAYQQVNIHLIYLLGILLFLLSSLPFVIKMKERILNLFMEMEVIN